MPNTAPPADSPVRTSSGVDAMPLRLAEPEDVMQAIAFALRYRGHKRIDTAGEARGASPPSAWSTTCARPGSW